MFSIILFVLTFVFGVLQLASRTKLFDTGVVGFIEAISPFQLNEFWRFINKLVFYFSLCYQTYFWTLKLQIVNV